MCRICGGTVRQFFDFGPQPLSDTFPFQDDAGDEFFFRLAVGVCGTCTMVQLMEEVPREQMFHHDYPYHSKGSAVMRAHFEATARDLLAGELTGDDPFCVEIGSNDGVMLGTVAAAGVRHLGVEPCGGVAERARRAGVTVEEDFFEEATAKRIAAEHGPADVVFAANTICHIPYLDSIFRGLDELLTPGGVFVFEDPYLGDIVERNTFDQIYDEHFYLFSATSVAAAARHNGFALVDVQRLPVHGGEVRYTLARSGARPVSGAVGALLAEEAERGLADPAVLDAFGSRIERVSTNLVVLLRSLRESGGRIAAYGATAKSATVLNYAGVGPDLVSCVYDSTPSKWDRVMPGSHIPIRPADRFTEPYPDYVLLLAWNHADEIVPRETGFAASGGRWIVYSPEVGYL